MRRSWLWWSSYADLDSYGRTVWWILNPNYSTSIFIVYMDCKCGSNLKLSFINLLMFNMRNFEILVIFFFSHCWINVQMLEVLFWLLSDIYSFFYFIGVKQHILIICSDCLKLFLDSDSVQWKNLHLNGLDFACREGGKHYAPSIIVH